MKLHHIIRQAAICSCFLIIMGSTFGQETLTATYSSAIPTHYANPPVHDPLCNGPDYQLVIPLPSDVKVHVTNVNVKYTMLPSNPVPLEYQRSKIYFVNENLEEPSWISPGASENYERDIDIANGSYSGVPELIFELWAVRTTYNSGGCSTSACRVVAGTWTITVTYTAEYPPVPKVGVNTDTPEEALDVNGKLKVSDDTEAPVAGTIRFNSAIQDFEGYDGTRWYSLTGKTITHVSHPNESTSGYPGSGTNYFWNVNSSNKMEMTIQFDRGIDPSTFVLGTSFLLDLMNPVSGTLTWNASFTEVVFISDQDIIDLFDCNGMSMTLKGSLIKDENGYNLDGNFSGLEGGDFVFYLYWLC